jgi:hypothetical protein
MPSFRDVRGIVEDDEALYLSTSEECNGGNSCLPTKDAKPTYAILEPLILVFRYTNGRD